MKEINIKIKHNLTPMHSELVEEMIELNMKAFQTFWNNKSKKEFTVAII